MATGSITNVDEPNGEESVLLKEGGPSSSAATTTIKTGTSSISAIISPDRTKKEEVRDNTGDSNSSKKYVSGGSTARSSPALEGNFLSKTVSKEDPTSSTVDSTAKAHSLPEKESGSSSSRPLSSRTLERNSRDPTSCPSSGAYSRQRHPHPPIPPNLQSVKSDDSDVNLNALNPFPSSSGEHYHHRSRRHNQYHPHMSSSDGGRYTKRGGAEVKTESDGKYILFYHDGREEKERAALEKDNHGESKQPSKERRDRKRERDRSSCNARKISSADQGEGIEVMLHHDYSNSGSSSRGSSRDEGDRKHSSRSSRYNTPPRGGIQGSGSFDSGYGSDRNGIFRWQNPLRPRPVRPPNGPSSSGSGERAPPYRPSQNWHGAGGRPSHYPYPPQYSSEGGSYPPPYPSRSQEGDEKQQGDVNVISPEGAPLSSSAPEGGSDRYSSPPRRGAYADRDNMFDWGISPPGQPTPSSGHPSGDNGDDVGSTSQYYQYPPSSPVTRPGRGDRHRRHVSSSTPGKMPPPTPQRWYEGSNQDPNCPPTPMTPRTPNLMNQNMPPTPFSAGSQHSLMNSNYPPTPHGSNDNVRSGHESGEAATPYSHPSAVSDSFDSRGRPTGKGGPEDAMSMSSSHFSPPHRGPNPKDDPNYHRSGSWEYSPTPGTPATSAPNVLSSSSAPPSHYSSNSANITSPPRPHPRSHHDHPPPFPTPRGSITPQERSGGAENQSWSYDPQHGYRQFSPPPPGPPGPPNTEDARGQEYYSRDHHGESVPSYYNNEEDENGVSSWNYHSPQGYRGMNRPQDQGTPAGMIPETPPEGGRSTMSDDTPVQSNTRYQYHPMDPSQGRQEGDKITTVPATPEEKRIRDKERHTAILAGAAAVTQPAAAVEVDFELTNPPKTPIVPPSKEPLCDSASQINSDDVLCGRGGGTNSQIGNRRFRQLVQDFQPIYLLARRKEKPLMARSIVLIIRKRGGRFLKKDEATGAYFDVGDEKAEAKTSQALREGLDVRATKSAATSMVKEEKKKKKEAAAAAAAAAAEEQRMAHCGPQEDGYGGYGPPPHHYHPHGPPPHPEDGYGYPPPGGYPPYPPHAHPHAHPHGPPPSGAGYDGELEPADPYYYRKRRNPSPPHGHIPPPNGPLHPHSYPHPLEGGYALPPDHPHYRGGEGTNPGGISRNNSQDDKSWVDFTPPRAGSNPRAKKMPRSRSPPNGGTGNPTSSAPSHSYPQHRHGSAMTPQRHSGGGRDAAPPPHPSMMGDAEIPLGCNPGQSISCSAFSNGERRDRRNDVEPPQAGCSDAMMMMFNPSRWSSI